MKRNKILIYKPGGTSEGSALWLLSVGGPAEADAGRGIGLVYSVGSRSSARAGVGGSLALRLHGQANGSYAALNDNEGRGPLCLRARVRIVVGGGFPSLE